MEYSKTSPDATGAGDATEGRRQLLAAIADLRTQAGNPSIAAVAKRADPRVSPSTVARLFTGESLLSWRAVAAIVTALGGDPHPLARLWRQANPGHDTQTGSQSEQFRRAIPAIIGKKGIGLLLGVATGTVRDWHNHSQAAVAAGEHTWRHLPEPDRVEDGRALWFPVTIVKWAVRTGRLPRNHGLSLPGLPPTLWSQADIAAHFGVHVETVRDRWRYHYVHAVRRKLAPPPKALPPETLNVAGVPLWDPQLVLDWGVQLGKLDATYRPNPLEGSTVPRWVSAAPAVPAPPPVPDAVRERLQRGETFDQPGIAEFFGVKAGTVRMWRSSWGSGKNFPQPDAGQTLDGIDTWEKATVYEWGRKNGRIVNGVVVLATGGRPEVERPETAAA